MRNVLLYETLAERYLSFPFLMIDESAWELFVQEAKRLLTLYFSVQEAKMSYFIFPAVGPKGQG